MWMKLDHIRSHFGDAFGISNIERERRTVGQYGENEINMTHSTSPKRKPVTNGDKATVRGPK